MLTTTQTLQQYRKLYYTVLAAMVVVILFCVGSILFVTAPLGFYTEWQFVVIMRVSAAMFTFVGAMASTYVFERSMRSTKNMVYLKQRLEVFTTAYSIKLFLCGFGVLACCLTFLFSGDWYTLIGAAICLAITAWATPTHENIALWLYMPDRMKAELEG